MPVKDFLKMRAAGTASKKKDTFPVKVIIAQISEIVKMLDDSSLSKNTPFQ